MSRTNTPAYFSLIDSANEKKFYNIDNSSKKFSYSLFDGTKKLVHLFLFQSKNALPMKHDPAYFSLVISAEEKKFYNIDNSGKKLSSSSLLMGPKMLVHVFLFQSKKSCQRNTIQPILVLSSVPKKKSFITLATVVKKLFSSSMIMMTRPNKLGHLFLTRLSIQSDLRG